MISILAAMLTLQQLASPPVSATLQDDQILQQGESEARLHQAGSIAKFACSIAALRLQQDGVLSLDEPIALLLDEEALPTALRGQSQGPTLRQLLQNRSGFSAGLMAYVPTNPAIAVEPLSAQAAASRIAGFVEVSEPGEAFEYYATNWLYAQAVLEATTGATMTEVIDAFVLDPAGMSDTTVFSGQLGPEAAQPASAGRPMPTFLACAGGLAATPTDLLSLARYPFVSDDFTPHMRDELFAVATPEEHYALGGRVREYVVEGDERTLVWLTGSNGPYKSVVVYDPVADSGFAAMSADNDFEPLTLARDAWLEDAGYSMVATATEATP